MENPENHHELENLAPNLAKLTKSKGFSVPENYFSDQQKILAFECFKNHDNGSFSLPEAYFSTLAQNIENRIITDKLQNTHSENVFDIPEDYFNSQSEKLAQRLLIPQKSWSFNQKFKKYSGIAALLVVVLSSTLLLYKHKITNNNLVSHTKIDTSTIISASTNLPEQDQKELENYLINHYSAEDLALNLN